jgi:hypothetical protein
MLEVDNLWPRTSVELEFASTQTTWEVDVPRVERSLYQKIVSSSAYGTGHKEVMTRYSTCGNLRRTLRDRVLSTDLKGVHDTDDVVVDPVEHLLLLDRREEDPTE